MSGSVVDLAPGESLPVAREAPVVVIPVYGQPQLFERCLRSVLRNTDGTVPILVADDASPDGSPRAVLDRVAAGSLEHTVYFLRQPANLGFPENVNTAFAASAPGDVALVNSDCEVGPEWLERLRAAALSDTSIATATALASSGTILTVPRDGTPRSEDVDAAARAVAARSLRLRPRIPTAVGYCVYIKRSALELVGVFDPVFSPGYGEEVDFSQRCALRGLVHVAADDVYVLHVGGASLSPATQQAHEKVIERRYPYYHPLVQAVAGRRSGPLARALALAETALEGRLSVTIDARCLGPTVTGTQVLVLQLLGALARSGRVRLRALVQGSVADETLRGLEELGVEILNVDDLPEEPSRTAVVHRPYQVAHFSELPLLERLGDRLVITHLDLIAYRTPGYARTAADWLGFHGLTRSALAGADAVLFISRHAADDAIAEDLIDEQRAYVTYLGVDEATLPAAEHVRPKALPDTVADGRFLLYVGTDFRHKNRLFSLELLEALEQRHGWDGHLVLAGPHAASGTSEDDEAAYLAARRTLAKRVVSLGPVSEAEKAWLYARSAGVVYPSVYEGFGIIPFEAAAYGRPCFFPSQTSLAETLPPACATIVPWNVEASADAVHAVLADTGASRALATAIAAAGQRFTWGRTVDAVLDAYEDTLLAPSRDLRALHDGGYAESVAVVGASVTGLALPPDAHRALLSVLARPWLQRPLLASMRLAFRAGYLLKHRRLPDERGI